ncbi:MAG: hypothetical protein HGB05_14935 [Chloroflexi bacterium]|nr:hypothetical protein [Chloroflexota bacterium]
MTETGTTDHDVGITLVTGLLHPDHTCAEIVRLPAQVVMDAMALAPRNYTLGGRLPGFDLNLDGRALYCATDGCGVETIDFAARQRRPSKKEDVADMARVSDYLSAIGMPAPIHGPTYGMKRSTAAREPHRKAYGRPMRKAPHAMRR